MQQKKCSSFSHWIGVIAIGVTLGVGMQFAQAWVPAPASPPNDNVQGPVTVGVGLQTKAGDLIARFMGANKMYSNSTTVLDPGTTLVTKDYVDAQSGGTIDWSDCEVNPNLTNPFPNTTEFSCSAGYTIVSHSCAIANLTNAGGNCYLTDSETIRFGGPAGTRVYGNIKCCKLK